MVLSKRKCFRFVMYPCLFVSKEMDKVSQFDYLLLVLAHLGGNFYVLIYQRDRNNKQTFVDLYFVLLDNSFRKYITSKGKQSKHEQYQTGFD